MKALAGIFIVAAVATACDFIWYSNGVSHTVVNGIIHGTTLLTAVGLVLGFWAGRVLKGLPVGVLAGVGGALSYYLLIAIMDKRTYGPAIPGAWIIMWLILAALEGRWLRSPQRRSWNEVAGRGLMAAVLGSIAFYLVLTTLWGRPPATGRNYALQFVAWAFAWTPGLLSLTIGSGGGSITSAELRERLERGETPNILDVRSRSEFKAGHVPGAVNIPFNEIPFRTAEVPGGNTDTVIVYCGYGPRAHIAAEALGQAAPRKVVYLKGHWASWKKSVSAKATQAS